MKVMVTTVDGVVENLDEPVRVPLLQPVVIRASKWREGLLRLWGHVAIERQDPSQGVCVWMVNHGLPGEFMFTVAWTKDGKQLEALSFVVEWYVPDEEVAVAA